MANVITPLSAEDQLALRNKAKAELERLESTLADEKLKKKIDEAVLAEYKKELEKLSSK